MVFNIRIVLASVLFSLAIVPALAQTDIQCNDTGSTGDCTQFIKEFCADVARMTIKGNTGVSHCFDDSGFTCDLTAHNTHDAAGNPSKENCEKVLNKVAESCPKGGGGKFTASAQFIFSIADTDEDDCFD